MNKFTRSINGDVPVMASLYEDEEFITSQEGVGLYDGYYKSPGHQIGSVHLTSHRLLYVDQASPRTHSVSLNLSYVRQSDYYSGFLKSSPKVSLTLGMLHEASSSAGNDSASSVTAVEPDTTRHFQEAWVCSVCSYSNPPTASEGIPKCVLCGVPKDVSKPTSTPNHRPLPIKINQTPFASSSSTLAPSLVSRSAPGPLSLVSNSSVRSAPASPTKPVGDTTSTTDQDAESIPCPACTFLNHKSMKICELCSTPLKPVNRATQARQALNLSSSPSSLPQSPAISRSSTPAPSSKEDYIRISFRKGGDKAFYASLKKTLLQKAWTKSSSVSVASSGTRVAASSTGIHGILESVSSNAQAQNQNLGASLKDLEALMSKAKEMVQLAESLNLKLTAQEQLQQAQGKSISTTEPEEATFIRSSLARLGLPSAAVTQDMIKDDQVYHEELAKELAAVLLGIGKTGSGPARGGMIKTHGTIKGQANNGLIGEKGIIGLDEVWCGWNRARGIALLPPSTLLAVLPHLPRFTNPPIQLRTFSHTGLRVLHTPQFTHSTFAARLSTLLREQPRTSLEIATIESVSIGLAEEMIAAVEDEGEVLKDEGSGGYEPVKWYRNTMKELKYDGSLVSS